jgi:riboflavin-specific deaminase-like protein
MSKSTLWAALCDAAHQESADLVRGLVRTPEGWQVEALLEPEAQVLADVFCPLLGPLPVDRPFVIGHLAQSLDGCIAQADGESHWISGEVDLDHTHRLRAICDVVMVGAETAAKDDCRLSVRRVDGPHPVRVVLDPQGRLESDRKLFHAVGGATLWLVGGAGADKPAPHEQVEVVPFATTEGQFDLHELMDFFHQRGFRRVFVEGGGITIFHFLKAQLMDRLHIAVAPILIGGGRPTIGRALASNLADCPRPAAHIHALGSDWLFDCDFRSPST